MNIDKDEMLLKVMFRVLKVNFGAHWSLYKSISHWYNKILEVGYLVKSRIYLTQFGRMKVQDWAESLVWPLVRTPLAVSHHGRLYHIRSECKGK